MMGDSDAGDGARMQTQMCSCLRGEGEGGVDEAMALAFMFAWQAEGVVVALEERDG